jgi:hypothetical protein
MHIFYQLIFLVFFFNCNCTSLFDLEEQDKNLTVTIATKKTLFHSNRIFKNLSPVCMKMFFLFVCFIIICFFIFIVLFFDVEENLAIMQINYAMRNAYKSEGRSVVPTFLKW